MRFFFGFPSALLPTEADGVVERNQSLVIGMTIVFFFSLQQKDFAQASFQGSLPPPPSGYNGGGWGICGGGSGFGASDTAHPRR